VCGGLLKEPNPQERQGRGKVHWRGGRRVDVEYLRASEWGDGKTENESVKNL